MRVVVRVLLKKYLWWTAMSDKEKKHDPAMELLDVSVKLMDVSREMRELQDKLKKAEDLNEAYEVTIKEFEKSMTPAREIFCECKDGNHEWCVDPDLVLVAMEDVRQHFTASNWHNDKFDRAVKAIKTLCVEHGIPMRFIRPKGE